MHDDLVYVFTAVQFCLLERTSGRAPPLGVSFRLGARKRVCMCWTTDSLRLDPPAAWAQVIRSVTDLQQRLQFVCVPCHA